MATDRQLWDGWQEVPNAIRGHITYISWSITWEKGNISQYAIIQKLYQDAAQVQCNIRLQ